MLSRLFASDARVEVSVRSDTQSASLQVTLRSLVDLAQVRTGHANEN